MKVNLDTLKVGADPEFFLRDTTSNSHISAHGWIKGSKLQPMPTPKGAQQLDGTAGEFNIDPAMSAQEFVDNITETLEYIQHQLPLNLVIDLNATTVTFPKDYWKQIPSSSKELGCDPDYNAWTMTENSKPNPKPVSMRTAGGHVHIGWTEDLNPFDPEHFANCAEVARVLDWFLGVPSLFWDDDQKRRTLYGAAGSFRPKSYGMEYRVLSNAWLRSPALIGAVYRSVRMAMNQVNKQHDTGTSKWITDDVCCDIIKDADKALALDLMPVGAKMLFQNYLPKSGDKKVA